MELYRIALFLVELKDAAGLVAVVRDLAVGRVVADKDVVVPAEPDRPLVGLVVAVRPGGVVRDS